jgi:5S rRNA maturation endonuclease (ribonuclease M5)
VPKIICRWHGDSTPSMELYPDHGFCYVCGKYAFPDELKDVQFTGEQREVEPEDLNRTFEYINRLPKARMRGLEFPVDEHGYYVVWPDRTYYKKRLNGGKARYIGAAGHAKPVFWANKAGSQALIVVEGEINAMSIAAACPEYDVMSPGGAGDFNAKRAKLYLKSMSYYEILLIITDADKAGALACIELMGALSGSGQKIKHHLAQPDANEVLQHEGKEALREQVRALVERDLEGGA